MPHWQATFNFQSKQFYYNRIPFNNASERAVEVPIAFDFLASLRKATPEEKILEIGNTLVNYENSLSDYVGVRGRRVVDKFEKALGVENVDLMDLPLAQKYGVIISISTVEHIGQGADPTSSYGERSGGRDREAPLKALVKIYDLLEVGGKAFITVPFGKLIDGDWYVQFSKEYLDLLTNKYGVPKEDVTVGFLGRTAMELEAPNPYQLWREVRGEELGMVEYNIPWPRANALAVIQFTKASKSKPLSLKTSTIPPTPLNYDTPVLLNGIFGTGFIFPVKPNEKQEFSSGDSGFIFYGPYLNVSPGDYELVLSLKIDRACQLIFDVVADLAGTSLFKKQINSSGEVRGKIRVLPNQKDLEFRLFNSSGAKVKIRVEQLRFKKLL